MSEDKTTDVLLEWFKNNLPEDYDLQQEIATRAERVFRHVVMRHHQQVNTPIFIGVSNNLEDASRLSITMNVYGIIFLGVMAKAILDSIAGQFQALSIISYKQRSHTQKSERNSIPICRIKGLEEMSKPAVWLSQ